MAQINFSLAAHEIDELARVAAARDVNRTQLIRALVAEERARLGLGDPRALFLDCLINAYGAGSSATFTIDGNFHKGEKWHVEVSVTTDDTDGAGRPFTPTDAPLTQYAAVRHTVEPAERVTVELEDCETGARVYVVTMPLRLSSTFTIKLIDLHPVMSGDLPNSQQSASDEGAPNAPQ